MAADYPKSDLVQTEMKKLEGTSRGVSATANGKAVADQQITALRLTMKAYGTWVMSDGKEQMGSRTFTIDPAKKPRTASFLIASGKTRTQHAGHC